MAYYSRARGMGNLRLHWFQGLTIQYHFLFGSADGQNYHHIFWDSYCSIYIKCVLPGMHSICIFLVSNSIDGTVYFGVQSVGQGCLELCPRFECPIILSRSIVTLHNKWRSWQGAIDWCIADPAKICLGLVQLATLLYQYQYHQSYFRQH